MSRAESHNTTSRRAVLAGPAVIPAAIRPPPLDLLPAVIHPASTALH
jgi:hypothetical protein